MLVLAACLAGCAAKYDFYEVPKVDEADASTLIGSETETPGFESNQRNYLIAVDGRFINRRYCGVDNVTKLAPGTHTITVSFLQDYDYVRSDLVVAVPPRERLTLRHKRNGQVVDLWVEDASGKNLGGLTNVTLGKHEAAKAPPGFGVLMLMRDCP